MTFTTSSRYPETAALIRSARLRKGISQERGASAIGCSRLQWIRWEQGLHRPDPDGYGRALCDLLDIEPAKLADADDDEEESPAVQPLTRGEFEMLGHLMARLGATIASEETQDVLS